MVPSVEVRFEVVSVPITPVPRLKFVEKRLVELAVVEKRFEVVPLVAKKVVKVVVLVVVKLEIVVVAKVEVAVVLIAGTVND